MNLHRLTVKIQKYFRNRGITLIELLIVMGVVGVLASAILIVINPLTQFEKARDQQRKKDIASIRLALELYHNDHGEYPKGTGDPTFRITDALDAEVAWGSPFPPYMTKLPYDTVVPRLYVYVAAADRQSYQLYAALERRQNDPDACQSGPMCSRINYAASACGQFCNYGISSDGTPVDSGAPPTPTSPPPPTPTPTINPSITPPATPTPTIPPTQLTLSASQDVNEDGASYDESSTQLWIGNGASVPQSYTGLRFQNLTIQKNATILSARVEVYKPNDEWIDCIVRIAADNVGSSLPFSSGDRPSNRTVTSAFVDYDCGGPWVANTWYQSPDIAALVQELVNRADWVSGNNASIILKGIGGPFTRKYDIPSVEAGANRPRLIITHTP